MSLGYAVSIDLELIYDSRYEAETWFRDNVTPASSVGAFSNPQYLPRVHELGYATYPVRMDPEAFTRNQPEYLILTSYNYEDYDASQRACMDDLVAGELGYNVLVEFRGRFLGAGSTWLSLGGWGVPLPGKISPTLTVLRRTVP
jgi:hypothetical protein